MGMLMLYRPVLNGLESVSTMMGGALLEVSYAMNSTNSIQR